MSSPPPRGSAIWTASTGASPTRDTRSRTSRATLRSRKWSGSSGTASCPGADELAAFRKELTEAAPLPAEAVKVLKLLPKTMHPMRVLQMGVALLGGLDPDAEDSSPEANRRKAVRLVARVSSLTTAFHRIRIGQPAHRPAPGPLARRELPLHALRAEAARRPGAGVRRRPGPLRGARAERLDLHGPGGRVHARRHALRGVGGGRRAQGPPPRRRRRGGHAHAGGDRPARQRGCLHPTGARREAAAHGLRAPRLQGRRPAGQDPAHARRQGLPATRRRRVWYETAIKLHEAVNREKGLIPNVDFYSAPLFKALGIPVDLFVPVIAVSRIAGWTANLMEQYARQPAHPAPRGLRGAERPRVPAARRAGRLMPASLVQKLVASHLVSRRARARAGDRRSGWTRCSSPTRTAPWRGSSSRRWASTGSRPPTVVTYADHQVYQFDARNTDDHRYLQTASRRFGGYYSKPGNGICHQVHLETFGAPGRHASRHGQPHAALRSARDAGDRGRRPRRRLRDGRQPVLLPPAARRAGRPDRPASALGGREGRHPRAAAPPHGPRRLRQDLRVRGAGRGDADRAPARDDREHGGRAGPDHLDLPFRRRHARLPRAPGPRRDVAPARRRPGRRLRRHARDRSLGDRAARRAARLAGSRRPGRRGRGHVDRAGPGRARARTARGRTCPSSPRSCAGGRSTPTSPSSSSPPASRSSRRWRGRGWWPI